VPLLQASPDDKAAFLADFRALRDNAALDLEELAARAHFPRSILKDAETGPELPGLPVLAAYVRACDGDVTEWEERWRRLEDASGDDDGLPVRAAGASPAAVAGARAGVSVTAADVHDAERIKAALRGDAKHQDERDTADDLGGDATVLANGHHVTAQAPAVAQAQPPAAAQAQAHAPTVAVAPPPQARPAELPRGPSVRLLLPAVLVVLIGCVLLLVLT
jgi:Helix-turn-helix domain